MIHAKTCQDFVYLLAATRHCAEGYCIILNHSQVLLLRCFVDKYSYLCCKICIMWFWSPSPLFLTQRIIISYWIRLEFRTWHRDALQDGCFLRIARKNCKYCFCILYSLSFFPPFFFQGNTMSHSSWWLRNQVARNVWECILYPVI